MKKFLIIFWLLLLICLLTSCSKKDPSVAIAENIKSDITVIEHQIQDIKENLTTECKTPVVESNLNIIQENMKNLKSKVNDQVLVCNTQKEVLNQENSKLKIIIGFLIFIIGSFIILKIKKIL